MFQGLRSFWFGFSLPYRSVMVIAQDVRLMILSILPILVTLVISVWAIRGIQTAIQATMIHYFLSWGWNPSSVWAELVLFSGKIILVILGALTFTFMAGIIAAPFNDFLAERAEARAEPPFPPVPSQGWLGRIRLIRIDIAKSLAVALGTLIGLFFSWVPFLNFLVLIMTGLLVTYQFISYPQTRREIGFAGGFHFLRTYFAASLGFGLVTLGLFSIPLISILALPVSVVGGTLLVAWTQKISKS